MPRHSRRFGTTPIRWRSKFSTRVTGLYCSFSGRDSVRPDRPDAIVPSQKASTSARGIPELVQASVTASTRRSSAPLSQCSPKGVQPIPTMATRSRIPLLAISSAPPQTVAPGQAGAWLSRSSCGRRSAVNSRRNVISTRWPMATVDGSTSVSSHWNRPPPSKSTTTTTTGGLREYASRSRVWVTIVPGTSARRSISIWSTAWHSRHTRCGGRCRRLQFWHRLAENPNFQSSPRWEAGAVGRTGSGRRGGSRRSCPRQVRNVG